MYTKLGKCVETSFNLSELQFILTNKKELVHISNAMSPNLPTQGKNIFLEIYNAILNGRQIPSQWKETLIIHI